ncbi:MAG TPA: MFS transporter [Chloroflexota bacterium]|nr:MFS transporter [Chloroflexota bacterium]
MRAREYLLDEDRPDGRVAYKWIALSNTTLGVLMATINASIVLIAMPTIFNGIKINPLTPGNTSFLLWILMGYMVVTSTLLVTAGRISDMYGRVRLYTLGFAIFTVGSILLFITPSTGTAGGIELIAFRIVQAVGGAFLFANSAAILTDAFPARQRGLGLGINQIAAIGGSVIGLILGGVLASFNWRLVFLVSVPFGIIGTVWAYLMLRETAALQRQKLDVWGNVTFAGGLTILLVALTYGLMPYGSHTMGWSNPWVIAGIAGGAILLVAFAVIEVRTEEPMFRLELFKIRAFAAGNISGWLASIARGGLQFMLIIWLQGIWLPIHGYSFAETPLWAGIYMLPMMFGFLFAGPVSGYLSDRYGARPFSTGGMVLAACTFVGLTFLPANFNYVPFAILLFLNGIGMGLFSSPNTSSIMSSVPAEHRGVASGMRATLQNSGMLFSMTIFFTIVILGLSQHLPSALFSGLTAGGLPAAAAARVSHIPPTAALFSAFLGYNPMAHILPAATLGHLSTGERAHLLGHGFFPHLISPPFMDGLRYAFYVSAAMSVVAAIASLLRGRQYFHEQAPAAPVAPPFGANTREDLENDSILVRAEAVEAREARAHANRL